MTGYTSQTLKHAKALRRAMTDAERRLWAELRGAKIDGRKFRRQQPIGPYIVDFVCADARLVIEADGSQHAECDRDVVRDSWLESRGYRVMRFWNNDVMGNLEGVADAIRVALQTNPSPTPTKPAAKSPYPLPQGERGWTT